MSRSETLYPSVENFSTPSSPSIFDDLTKIAQVDLGLNGTSVDPETLLNSGSPGLPTLGNDYFEVSHSSTTTDQSDGHTHPPHLFEECPLDSFDEPIDNNDM
ncbi:hypothetical protein M422DRAFT_47833 [Sphaerobolus stellatus SS14]|uniref:Uncharacterized protein n=1 Tax=Sphaerobolus stellatus (strain SS14) TaxID=990650 RepID=A0A0C9UKG9_SPHS4|nr:hypothetical protein M422DRAFT_47833 [Sphaerobolus stellatus SS14]